MSDSFIPILSIELELLLCFGVPFDEIASGNQPWDVPRDFHDFPPGNPPWDVPRDFHDFPAWKSTMGCTKRLS